MAQGDWTAAEVTNANGLGRWVLVCEHASQHIPAELSQLDLDAAARFSHVAWDIGALNVALEISSELDAPLVAGGISRLVYDCNRPFSAYDCIPTRSEIYEIPGNADLDAQARQTRFNRVHEPFHDAVSKTLAEQMVRVGDPVLVTIHSFTPLYNGIPRHLELGFLYHSDPDGARAVMAQEQARGAYITALNEPYGPADGVTYTLEKHGEAQGLTAIMIEIRNDLIDTKDKARAMARHLSQALLAAFPLDKREATE